MSSLIPPPGLPLPALAALLTLAGACGRDRPHNAQIVGSATDTRAAQATAELRGAAGADFPPPAVSQGPTVYGSLELALEAVLASEPQTRVLGVGELHITHATRALRSALSQFFAAPLDSFAPRTSDVVMETWAPPGRCGATETKVETNVAKAIERPAAVLDEVTQSLYRARDLGITPHVLKVACEDYERVLGKDGEVDYEAFLLVVTDKLAKVTGSVIRHRDAATGADAATDATTDHRRNLVIVYSGALHNDVAPIAGIEDLSYTIGLGETATEVDLLVPALADAHALTSAAPWYASARAKVGRDQVVLVRRGPRSYAILLPTDLAATPPSPQ